MSQAEGKLSPERNREWRLARVVNAIRKPYDFILVDCPPGTGAVSDNALLACRRVLAPAEMHEASMPSVSGVMKQLRSLGRIFEVNVDMLGFVPVAYRVTPDEVANLEALQAERPEWVTSKLGYRKAIMSLQKNMKEIFLDERAQAPEDVEKKKKNSEPDRKTTSFYIDKAMIAELDDAWYALLGDGIRIDRVDFREAIVRLGLDHLDELRTKYNLSPEEADA